MKGFSPEKLIESIGSSFAFITDVAICFLKEEIEILEEGFNVSFVTKLSPQSALSEIFSSNSLV